MTNSHPILSEAPDFPAADARAMLHEHGAFLYSLARALTRDPGAAADLAQETMIDGLGVGGSVTRPVNQRTWLATVLRRKAINRMRSEQRRSVREEAAARPEQLAGPDVTVAQLEVGERLLALVRGLDEPVREAITARFYRGLSYPAIAEEAGLPVTTVKSRVERGLKVLRGNLDRGEGGRPAWLAALGGLASPGLHSSTPKNVMNGGPAAGTGWALTAAILSVGILSIGAVALWLGRDEPADPGGPIGGSFAFDTPPAKVRAVAIEVPSEPVLPEIGYSGSEELIDAIDDVEGTPVRWIRDADPKDRR